MKILQALGLTRPAASTAPTPTGIVSPWADASTLSTITVADILGVNMPAITRETAMTVPAMAQARWLITTALATHPLVAYRKDERLAAQPAWLTRTDMLESPQLRLLWTLDDLIFHGYSLWLADRSPAGQLLRVERVPPAAWRLNEAGAVQLKDGAAFTTVTDELSVILFRSPQDPLLRIARRTLLGAIGIEEAWTARVKDPIPHTKLVQKEDIEVGLDEVNAVIDAYIQARFSSHASISYVPYGMDLEEMGKLDPALYIQGRNAVAVDIARFTSLPAQLLNASPVQSSLTYSTQEGGRDLFTDFSVSGWAMAIENRLSQDDVVPAGQSVKFDRSWATTIPTPPTSTPVED